MDKLKKCMTIMAIVGTFLITGLFCYIPFREIVKEAKRNTVSLEQEEEPGSGGQTEAELQENMTQASQTTQTEKNPTENAEMHRAVLFSFQQGKESLGTYLWQNSEGICYVFLPGFARNVPLQVKEITGDGSLLIGTRKIQEGDVLTDIADKEAYEFTLLDKKGEKVTAAPLVFFYASDLPVLTLTTESETMESIEVSKENTQTGALSLLDGEGKVLYQGEISEISGRGNSTYGLLKKPFKLKLKEKVSLFDFGESRTFNLLADGYDETKLRNSLAFGLADALGMEYVPKGQSVSLYCNGEYYGVYYLCEKVQTGEEQIPINDLGEYSSVAYTSAELAQLVSIESEDGMRKWTDCEVEGEDLSGGYLFERELPERYGEEKSGFITSQGDCYLLKTPGYATENQVNYIADYMQEFQDALQEPDGVNKDTGKHYLDYIDLDSFVCKYLTEEISRNYDGGVTSSFFYKKSDAQGGKLYAGPVWDFDVAFGNCTLDFVSSNPEGVTKLNEHVYGTSLFADLYQQPDFYNRMTEIYEQKALPYLTMLLETEIDNMASQMTAAAEMDDIRWEELHNRHQYYKEYDNNVRQLKHFLEERIKFLNEVWLEGEVYHSVSFMVDGELFKEYYYKDGEMLGKAPDAFRYHSLFMGWLTMAHDTPYDEFKPVYEDMVFYATWQQLPESEVVLTDGMENSQ